MRTAILVVAFLLTAISAKANTVYIASGGTGAGTSCSSAKDPSYFNTAGNWTTGTPTGIQIGPGTTVHLCGTFVGTAGSTLLTFQGNGSSSSSITLLFETNAVLTAPYWPSGNGSAPGGGAINLAGHGYLAIDGGTNGVIEDSDNGSLCSISPTPSPCFNNAQNSLGISAVATHDITVKNLTIRNLYVHSSVNDNAINMFNDGCVMFLGANNVTIDHVTAHDIHWCFQGGASNLTISNSEVYNADHGVAFGANANVGGVDIHNNHFHDFTNWDTTNDRYHHDYIHLWNHTAGTSVTDGVIYNNTFDGVFGANTTGNVYLEDAIHNITVFNNTFINTSDVLGKYGVWMAGEANGGQNISILNNYFASGAHVSGSGVPIFVDGNETGVTIENNIAVGGLYDISIIGTIRTVDHNLYDDLKTDYGDLNIFGWNGTSTASFTTWKSSTDCNCDANSLFATNANIKVNSGGVPQTGSVAIGAGGNLMSLATGAVAPLAFDKNGGARPTSGNWDIGAFQQGSGHPISVVQVRNPTYAKNTTMTVALTETAGDFLIAATGYVANVTATVTDTLGNTWHALTAQGNGNTGCGAATSNFSGIQLWYAENIKGGANQVKLQLSAQTFLWMGVIEYSGVKTSGSLLASTGTISTTVVSSISTGNLTAGGPNNLIIAAVTDTDQNRANMSAGSGYTDEGNAGIGAIFEDLVSVPPGTYNPSVTYNNGSDYCGAAAGAAFSSQ